MEEKITKFERNSKGTAGYLLHIFRFPVVVKMPFQTKESVF